MVNLRRCEFDQYYAQLILNGDFFEEDSYYLRERKRYFETLRFILDKVDDSSQIATSEVLEVGGGQIALLMNGIFGCKGVIADVNEQYGKSLVESGVEFKICDLLHDNLPDKERYDFVILCEVIEHLPIPPYKVLSKVANWMKPGGLLFVTTPNLYRLRNVIRLALGMRVFDTFFIPDRGQPIGHPLEYSAEHLSWQLKTAGFQDVTVQHRQLSLTGASAKARIARMVLSPLLIRQKFRDSLIATARKPSVSVA